MSSKFSHTRFEPMGHTKNPDIRIAKSIVDYIFRFLGITFLPGYREAKPALPVEGRWQEVGDEPEAELLPAVKKTGGQTSGSGRQTHVPLEAPVAKTNGSNGHHTKGSNGNGSKGTAARADADTGSVSLLERAGVAPKFELNLNDGPRRRGEQFATFQVDAPSCDNCGAITVRNGNCYLCHNCGNSMGCS